MTPPGDRTADLRGKADQLREEIASRAARVRRDAWQIASAARRPAGSVPLRIPSWALAAAVGAVAGLVAAVRRRRSAQP